MPIHKYLERIRFIDCLIRKRATGNTKTLANKLNLSRSVTSDFLKEMKEEGFPIAYSRDFNSYYYTEEGKAVDHLYEKELTDDDMKPITGGKTFFNLFFQSDYTGL
jgi:hypothetical protein